jgi:hypothetical protein
LGINDGRQKFQSSPAIGLTLSIPAEAFGSGAILEIEKNLGWKINSQI